MRIHRLVLMSFAYFPGCETTMINHCDGIKTNCDIWNLEWSSYSENSLHAYATGLRQNFWNHRSLTDEDVIAIANLLMENKLNCAEIANMFNISIDMVYSIKFKRAYFNLTSSFNFPSFVTDRNIIEKICQVMAENKPNKSLYDMNKTEKHNYYQKIINEAGIENSQNSVYLIRRIYRGESYLDISKKYNFF